ncbi:hypothetical protein [Sinomicrobium weinanense]|uniref:Uncharacterized protein n=1 Tax=Sinomicrobium weinanense TaxID=2842200 RepID=A0A926JQ29_9FLAO|nr:hypothetical protein [Sinomicrobium weinanense]MBC9795392.1 hypothetical protein [Sinomicrobium weinanense]MBU3122893.1 hypothetical protein [Sinomicrobium weinanense]
MMITRVQKLIVRQMAKGYTQPEVSAYLKRRGITPNSLSTIEKELLKLKKEFKAQSMVHLFVILIRKGHLKV